MPKAAPGTVTLTATVTSPTSTQPVTGTVIFFSGGSQVSSPIALVNGSAQMQTVLTYPGATVFTAQYSGDANHEPSTSAMFDQITTGSTTLSVTAQTGINTHQIGVTVTIQ
jgi:hypothetical protein